MRVAIVTVVITLLSVTAAAQEPPSIPQQIQQTLDTLVTILGEFEAETEKRLDALDGKVLASQKLLEAHHLAVVPTPGTIEPDEGTLAKTFKFIGKYILPAVGGLIAGAMASGGEE